MRISQALVAIILATGVKSVPQSPLDDDWTLPGIPLSLSMNEGTSTDLFVDSSSANQILAAPNDIASDNARDLLTLGSIHQVAPTDYLFQTRCSDGKSWQKRSGEICPVDEAPILCSRRGGLTLRKKTPSCCTGLETVERYPYGAGLISSRENCECMTHLANVIRLAAKTNLFSPIDLSDALNSASCKKRNGSLYCCDYVVSIVV